MSTRVACGSSPARASSSTTSSASAGESSTKRIRSALATAPCLKCYTVLPALTPRNPSIFCGLGGSVRAYQIFSYGLVVSGRRAAAGATGGLVGPGGPRAHLQGTELPGAPAPRRHRPVGLPRRRPGGQRVAPAAPGARAAGGRADRRRRAAGQRAQAVQRGARAVRLRGLARQPRGERGPGDARAPAGGGGRRQPARAAPAQPAVERRSGRRRPPASTFRPSGRRGSGGSR